MADKEVNITGAQRAAILMLGLGESLAAELLKHMDPTEVEQVGRAMNSLSGVSDEQVAHVLTSFHEELRSIPSAGVELYRARDARGAGRRESPQRNVQAGAR